MEVLHAWGKSWVLVGGGNSSTVTLAELRNDGSLLVQDHVVDSLLTRFQNATDLAATSIAGRPVIVVGGGDDGVTALTVLPDGRLAALAVQNTTTDLPLTGVSALEVVARSGVVDVYAGSESEAGLSRLHLDLSGWAAPRLGTAGADTLTGGSGDDLIWGRGGADVISGGAGRDRLMDGAGTDTLRGGAGADTFTLACDGQADVIVDFDPGEDRLDLSAWGRIYNASALEVLRQSDGSAWVCFGEEQLHITGRDGQVITEDGISRALDTALMHLPSGSITNVYDRRLVQARVPEGGQIAIAVLEENMGAARADGTSGRDSLIGNSADNELHGFGGNDTLDGGAGDDLMIGGAGNDLYRVADEGDQIQEDFLGGYDRVEAAISYRLGANLEDALLLGTDDISLTGNNLDNRLKGNLGDNQLNGNAGNDTLTSFGGQDTLRGGTGSDHYVLYRTGAVIVEHDSEGHDSVTTYHSFRLTAHLEDLELAGSGDLSGVGNDLNNLLVGNSGDNLLRGLDGNDTLCGYGGDDTLEGGAGDDVYYLSLGGGRIVEHAGGGFDQVVFSTSQSLVGFQHIESLRLTGQSNLWASGTSAGDELVGNAGNNRLNGLLGDDTLFGGDGADTLDGGAGNDVMAGGRGDDLYLVNAAGDQITEAANAGRNDRVRATVSYHLSSGVEILQLVGQSRLDGYGQAENNRLYGSAARNLLHGMGGDDILFGGAGDDWLLGGVGNDRLVGGAGRDMLAGGLGNDTYVVERADEDLIERADAGVDRVISTVSLRLPENFEDLVLIGTTQLDGYGNMTANVMVANRAGGMLRGYAGNDELHGGMSADTLQGDAGNDRLISGRGDDLLLAGDGADWLDGGWGRDLLYGGQNDDWAYGGNDDDRLFGEDGHDTLLGGYGADELQGATGNDWLNGGPGNDFLYGSTGNDTLIGGTGADTLWGGAGDDRLFGDQAGDWLIGGAGNDRYILHVTSAHIVETAGGGHDLIVSLLDSFALPEFIEDGLLGGQSDTRITGNSADNLLTGNGGDNVLIGGAGDDILVARSGDDRLRGDNGNDILHGEAGSDTLNGMAHDDRLNGGHGVDVLIGGHGADIFEFYRVDLNSGADLITDFSHLNDQISLIHFGGNFSGWLAEQCFVEGTRAQDANDFVIYDSASGRVWFDADGDGAGHAQLLCRVTSGTYLDHTDFQFF